MPRIVIIHYKKYMGENINLCISKMLCCQEYRLCRDVIKTIVFTCADANNNTQKNHDPHNRYWFAMCISEENIWLRLKMSSYVSLVRLEPFPDNKNLHKLIFFFQKKKSFQSTKILKIFELKCKYLFIMLFFRPLCNS